VNREVTMSDTVNFTQKEVKKYLDDMIKYWRNKRDNENCNYAKYYIDAFQSVKMSIFGEISE
jgi:hypothetical protein